MDRRLRAARAIALAFCLGAVQASTTDGSRIDSAIDLGFDQFYITPIGPHGLEMTPALRRLDGQRIRIAGFAFAQASLHDAFILTPVALHASAHAEEQADDLPPAHALVEATSLHGRPTALNGRIQVEGTLHLGRVESANGPSWVRIELEKMRPFDFTTDRR